MGLYETPAFLFDEDVFKERAELIKEALGDNIPLCFSIKANPFLLNCLPKVIDKVEVCSPGELSICQRLGVKPERIIYSGVMKEDADVERAISYGVGIITAESLLHAEIIEKNAVKSGKKMKLIARLTSGNQFGMDESCLEELVKNRAKYEGFELIGVHYYSGTQKKKLKNIEKDLEHLKAFLVRMKETYDYEPQIVEYGPGLAVNYFNPPYDDTDLVLLNETKEAMVNFAKEYPLSIEMGRFLASTCGTYITKVKDLKENTGTNYVICDGGIHHLKYYGQTMAMQIPPISKYVKLEDGQYQKAKIEEDDKKWAICGSLCTVADVLVREVALGELNIDDVLIFERCGAYSITEGSALFLSRMLPRVYIGTKEKGYKLVRDFICSDLINSVEGNNWR